jgi:hypothetical protein
MDLRASKHFASALLRHVQSALSIRIEIIVTRLQSELNSVSGLRSTNERDGLHSVDSSRPRSDLFDAAVQTPVQDPLIQMN